MSKPLEDCNIAATNGDGTYKVTNRPGQPSDLFIFREYCQGAGLSPTPLKAGTFTMQEARVADSAGDKHPSVVAIRSKVDPTRWPPQPTREKIIAENEAKAKQRDLEASKRDSGYGYGGGGYGNGGYGGRGNNDGGWGRGW